MKFKFPGVQMATGMPGHNEYGVPLHACNGYRHDAHYWEWIKAVEAPRLVPHLLTRREDGHNRPRG